VTHNATTTTTDSSAVRGMRVAVTGANGFLGTHCVDALRDAGAVPVALVRHGSDPGALDDREAVILRRVSYDDVDGLRAAMADVDGVIHCAGGGKVRNVGGFYRANTRTTEAIVAAVLRTGRAMRRFVLVSSIAAHGPCRTSEPADESSAPRPRSHYGKSKLAAESAVATSPLGRITTILRPPALYGPGDTRMLPVFRMARAGRVPMIAADGTTMLLAGRDCAEACVAALDRSPDGIRTYFVDDGEPLSRRALVAAIGRAVGTKPTVVPLPTGLGRIASHLVATAARAQGRAVAFSPDKMRDLGATEWRFDSRRIREELGWVPQIARDAGLAATHAAYFADGSYDA